MKISARLLMLGALLLTVAPFALADSTVINISGHDTFTASSLTFITPFASVGDKGLASSFSDGTVDYLLGTVNYMDNVSLLKVFTVTNSAGDVLTFFDTHNDATSVVDPATGFLNITLDETGYYSVNGGPAMSGYFDVTFPGNSADGQSGGSFLGSGGFRNALGIGPEPPTALYLGSALFGMAALLYVRRRKACPMA